MESRNNHMKEYTRGYFWLMSIRRKKERENEKEVKNSKQPSHEGPKQTLMRRFVFYFQD